MGGRKTERRGCEPPEGAGRQNGLLRSMKVETGWRRLGKGRFGSLREREEEGSRMDRRMWSRVGDRRREWEGVNQAGEGEGYTRRGETWRVRGRQGGLVGEGCESHERGRGGVGAKVTRTTGKRK